MNKLNHKKGFTQVVDFGFFFENTSKKLKGLFSKFMSWSNLISKNAKKFSKSKFTTGFTLIELLVVISIIGLLSSVVLASLTSARQKAKAAKIVADMNQLKTAFEMYRNDHGKYPNENIESEKKNQDAIDFLTTHLVANKYISSISNSSTNDEPSNDNIKYLTGEPNSWKLYYEDPIETYYKTCGGKFIKSYMFLFYNTSPLNFPSLGVNYNGEQSEDDDYVFVYSLTNWYCIGE